MSVPVSGMTDAYVLGYRPVRWDYELLKTHGVPMANYDKAKAAYHQITKASKPETRAAHQAMVLKIGT